MKDTKKIKEIAQSIVRLCVDYEKNPHTSLLGEYEDILFSLVLDLKAENRGSTKVRFSFNNS